jgi:hypothetical protein
MCATPASMATRCAPFLLPVSQPEELGLKPFCFPGAEADYFRERECAPAGLAVGQGDRLGFGVDLGPLAGRLRPDGEHVAQDGLPVGQVPLLVTVVEAQLPGGGHHVPSG